MRYTLYYLFFIFSFSLKAQVVNIESMRIDSDSVRFTSITELSTWYEDNNGQYIFTNLVSSTNQIKSKNLVHSLLVLGNYNTIVSYQGNLQSSWLSHIRYINKVNDKLNIESFGQYTGNAILDVSKRQLLGIGFRLQVLSLEHSKISIGNSYLLEYEENNINQISLLNHRNNFFISKSFIFSKQNIELNNTIYWQPKYIDINDFNILEQFKANFKIKSNMHVFLLIDFYYDSSTPLDRKQFYLSTRVGFGIKI